MNLIDCLIEDGKDRVRKQEGCAENGGHYKDVDYSPRRGVKRTGNVGAVLWLLNHLGFGSNHDRPHPTRTSRMPRRRFGEACRYRPEYVEQDADARHTPNDGP